jgi:diguanylate cyclase (GGDEF)-like protein
MSTGDRQQDLEGMRILVVDDQDEIRTLLQRRLKREGYRVDVAENGGEALNRLQTPDEFDLVLLDIMMPETDGYTVLRSIRQNNDPEELPVIMITAKAESEDRVQAFEEGANDYITKPIDFPVARERIRTHLSLKKAYKRIQELARRDELTGLYNRRHWMTLYENEFKRALRYENDLSVLIMDLDHFSAINDNHGHLAGDEVLKKVSEILQKATRSSDVLGRYGGEEFGLFLPETGQEEAVELGNRIREQIDEHDFSFEGTELPVTISVGTAELWSGRDDKTSLLNKADQALYEAKAAGRNCVERRRFKRTSIDEDVTVTLITEQSEHEGKVIDCGEGGLAVTNVDGEFEEGARLDLDAPDSLPGDVQPTDRVEVRWVAENEEGDQQVGLEFI